MVLSRKRQTFPNSSINHLVVFDLVKGVSGFLWQLLQFWKLYDSKQAI